MELTKPLSRRAFGRSSLGAGTIWILGRHANAQGTPETLLALPEAFELPVLTSERDPRTLHIKQTKRSIDPSMLNTPLDLPVSAIGFNPTYTGWEARNRLNLAMCNALIRTHAVSETKLDGTNYTDLHRMMTRGLIPDAPDWERYVERLASSETLLFRLMALPEDAPLDKGNVQWMEANLRKGVILNFTTAEGLMHYQWYADGGGPVDGWTYRVGLDGQLQIDLYLNLSGMTAEASSFPDRQFLYDYTFSWVTLLALTCLTITLGVFYKSRDSGGEVFSYYGNLFFQKYLAQLNSLPILFKDQNKLMLGENYEDFENVPLLRPEILI